MLFDDLPQTKKDAAASSNNTKEVKSQEQEKTEQDDSSSSKVVEPPASKDGKKGKSLVEAVGKAGTSMAFVPAALRKRKQPTKTQTVKNAKIKTETEKQVITKIGNDVSNTHVETKTVSITKLQDETKQEIVHIHNVIPQKDASDVDTVDNYKEPQHLTDLHAAVRSMDMYHPSMPNDYLAYRQRKENELMQKNLQKEAEKTIEMQQKLREHIESERQKALESGDVDKIIESRMGQIQSAGMGRGRGRGLNNLPAWLVKKQQEEKNKALP
ncbi:hypothetical protein CTEN210_03808 [Chaetoceros tenuissimus]|uniref:Uncharacterized protein n=1 Tax=Chaetoceros tenuissimus TaxID=426638 RepID=A0AAD3CK09_9STRA|nr:hypothetical protein CTEN210_03808 [Chaetoceros tenuissimus]